MKTPLILFLVFCMTLLSQASEAHRVIVLTDMGADPDDEQSLVRLLLYSNQLDIEGLVATTSVWQKNRIRPEYIQRTLDAYGKVRGNLLKHESGYPTVSELRGKLKEGIAAYGMAGVGEGKDTEGSEWIIRELEKEDERPLWISVWGGVNTLAQALYTLEKTRPPEVLQQLVAKLRVYTISDQDDSGAWIRSRFPELFYIVSPGDGYGNATWNGMMTVVDGIDNSTIGNEWIASNIQQGHGALGVCYPDVAWGVEGDTPAYLSLIPNGLNEAEHPNWGGWGGRYELQVPDFATIEDGHSDVVPEPETRAIWTDTLDRYIPHTKSEYGRPVAKGERTFEGGKVSLWRWREAVQNDFAARMDWCVSEYGEVNHPPVPVLGHEERIEVKGGHWFEMSAIESYDTDGDSLSYLWYPYPEAGSYEGRIEISGTDNSNRASVMAPKVAKPETLHFILEVTDKGTPSLTRYKRVVVTLVP